MGPREGPGVVVGREGERADTAAWVAGLARGDAPAPLVVRGPAGIGKTTLWLDVGRAAQRAGLLVLQSRPSEADTTLGYSGLTDLLAPHVDSWHDMLPSHLAAALASSLLLRERSADYDQLAVHRASQLALEALAGTATGLLVAVDDVQWLDPASGRTLAYALRRTSVPTIGLVVTWRDGGSEPVGLGPLLGEATTVELGPLPPGDTRRLVAGRRPDAPWTQVSSLARMSGGNPFYACELARSSGSGSEVPTSLREAASRRLAAARALGRPAIERAAVVGPTSPESYSADDLGRALDAAVEDHILVVDDVVRFDHPLLAWAAYQELPPGRRAALHRHAADRAQTLEARAVHLAKATTQPDESVAALLDRAGALAHQRFAVEAAADFAADAFRLTNASDIAGLGRRLTNLAEYRMGWDDAGTRDALARVRELGIEGRDRARAEYLGAYVSTTLDELAGSVRAALAEPELPPELSTQLRAEQVWIRGVVMGSDPLKAPDHALAIVADAADLAEDVRLGLKTVAAVTCSYAGRPDAEAQFEACRIMTEAGVAPRNRLSIWGVYAGHFVRQGRWRRAIELLEMGEREATRVGNDVDLGHIHHTRGWVEYLRGNTDELERRLAAARDLRWREVDLGDRITRLETLVQARRGESPSAVPSLVRAISDEALVLGPTGMTDIVDGVRLVALGRPEDAAVHFAALPSVMARSGAVYLRLDLVAPEAATALVAAGKTELARQLVDGLDHPARRGPLGEVLTTLCRGIVALGEGADDAADILGGARGAAARLDTRWLEGQAAQAEGQALRRAGRRRLAADASGHAAELFTAMALPLWAERAADAARSAVPRPRRSESLTPAEVRVVDAAVAGLSNAEIARSLYVTVATVEAHLTRAYRKLGVRSRSGLAGRMARSQRPG